MPDRPVKGLIFKVCDGPSVRFERADPLLCEERAFRVRVENGKATFEFKTPYETESEARKAVKDYIDQWEFLAGLQHGSHAFRFRLENPAYAEEESDSGGVRVRGGTRHSIEAGGELSVINHPRAYPTPPSGVQITPDVGRMFHRYLCYRENKEPLASMAYFCLTVLNRSVPQHEIKNAKGMASPSSDRTHLTLARCSV